VIAPSDQRDQRPKRPFITLKELTMTMRTGRPKRTSPSIPEPEKPIEMPRLAALPTEPSGELFPGEIPTPTPKEFASNAEERLPCLLILDVSESMWGDPIDRLSASLTDFRDSLLKHPRLRRSIDVSVVTYNDTPTVEPFVSAADWIPPQLVAKGRTRTALAVGAGLDDLEKRLAEYNAAGIAFHRPWAFLWSDGVPTESPEETQAIAARIHKLEAAKRLNFFPVGVNSSSVRSYLASLSKLNSPLFLTDVQFANFFRWVYVSVERKWNSLTTEEIELPSPMIRPDNPIGWAHG
jgi:uncharacterized protein YegL